MFFRLRSVVSSSAYSKSPLFPQHILAFCPGYYPTDPSPRVLYSQTIELEQTTNAPQNTNYPTDRTRSTLGVVDLSTIVRQPSRELRTKCYKQNKHERLKFAM